MFFIKLKSKAIRMRRKEHLLWTSCSCCLVASVVSNSLWPHGLQPTRLLCPWDSPDKNTGVGCHSHLQQIFPTQGSSPHLLCLLYCRQILYHWAFGEGCYGENPRPNSSFTINYLYESEHFFKKLHWSQCPDKSNKRKISLDSVGEGEGGIIGENSIETCMSPYVK